jgi:Cytochrome c7 and related cytochrome c
MAQVFDRNSNALARASLVLTGLIVIALGVTLDQLQRSPWVTRQGQRPDQPIPFSHKHHVEGLGLQCQYCHTTVEVSSYAGIPPTKTCINCHAQIWTNAGLLEPVRQSWATGQSIQWIKVHDLPDFVYFNHSIHVNKGIGCASCHGRVDEMPLMYMENSLQMEWCLNCHRNPASNLRPTAEIYNMAWEGPSSQTPVWCGSTNKGSGPTAGGVNCTTKDPGGAGPEVAMLQMAGPQSGTNLQPRSQLTQGGTASDASPVAMTLPVSYQKFTDQMELGRYLTSQYHIRPPNELTSCETCHR